MRERAYISSIQGRSDNNTRRLSFYVAYWERRNFNFPFPLVRSQSRISSKNLSSCIHCISISISIVRGFCCSGFCRPSPRTNVATLASRAVVYYLMSEQITIDTEMVIAYGAFIATTHTHAFCVVLCSLQMLLRRHWRKRDPTRKAVRALGGASPGHLDPVNKGK